MRPLEFVEGVGMMPTPIATSRRLAGERAAALFPAEKCHRQVESDGSDWKVTVTRLSDSETVTEKIPK